MAFNEIEKISLAAGDGPYEYWCAVGKHYWKMTMTESRATPPAMDGAILTCPVHAEQQEEGE